MKHRGQHVWKNWKNRLGYLVNMFRFCTATGLSTFTGDSCMFPSHIVCPGHWVGELMSRWVHESMNRWVNESPLIPPFLHSYPINWNSNPIIEIIYKVCLQRQERRPPTVHRRYFNRKWSFGSLWGAGISKERWNGMFQWSFDKHIGLCSCRNQARVY